MCSSCRQLVLKTLGLESERWAIGSLLNQPFCESTSWAEVRSMSHLQVKDERYLTGVKGLWKKTPKIALQGGIKVDEVQHLTKKNPGWIIEYQCAQLIVRSLNSLNVIGWYMSSKHIYATAPLSNTSANNSPQSFSSISSKNSPSTN